MSSSPGEHLATLIRLRDRLSNVARELETIARAVDIEINSFADAALRSGALKYADDEEFEAFEQ
jgi:hypothetical protein